MGTDPAKNDHQTSSSADDEPTSTDGPGEVTVDEPTDPSLSGTDEEDFGATEDPAEA